jgi:hypothetical protein
MFPIISIVHGRKYLDPLFKHNLWQTLGTHDYSFDKAPLQFVRVLEAQVHLLLKAILVTGRGGL